MPAVVEQPNVPTPEQTKVATATEVKAPSVGAAEQKLISTIDSTKQDPDSALKAILGETENPSDFTIHEQAEKDYIAQTTEKYKGLDARYVDERTNADVIDGQVAEYAGKVGVKHESVDSLSGKSFNTETRAMVGEAVQKQIDILFNSEKGRMSPDKQKSVAAETQRYLDLISQAQAEGDMSASLDAQTVLQLVENNVWALAYQDRVASENLLGDHGVRHLVDHNIKVGEKILDELARNGQTVRAIDRLTIHQVMIDHDMGYAMSPVREPIAQGKFGADGGHNVLAAKYTRQRAENPNSALAKVFNADQISVIHKGILSHDSRDARFVIGDESTEARSRNIESAIHVADNTHAFEDKLPELLYSQPDSLHIMRLMRTAGEVGDAAGIDALRAQLVDTISASSSYSADDKEALVNAAKFIGPESYRKTVPRICGNKPEFSMDAKGVLTVDVQESAIHREVVGVFAGEQNEQLKKFIGDVAGVKGVNLEEADTVTNPDGTVVVKLKGIAGSEARSDYQARLDTLIANPAFQEFINGTVDRLGDAVLGESQALLQKQHDAAAEGSEEKQALAQDLNSIKEQRKQNLAQYMNKEGGAKDSE